MSFFMISWLLFVAGIFMVLTRRNGIVALMGIELMMNASLLNFVALSASGGQAAQGQLMALFVLVVAAAEVAVALAIVLNYQARFGTADLDEGRTLGERD